MDKTRIQKLANLLTEAQSPTQAAAAKLDSLLDNVKNDYKKTKSSSELVDKYQIALENEAAKTVSTKFKSQFASIAKEWINSYRRSGNKVVTVTKLEIRPLSPDELPTYGNPEISAICKLENGKTVKINIEKYSQAMEDRIQDREWGRDRD